MLQEALDSVAGTLPEQCRSIGGVLLNLRRLAGLAQGLEGRVHWDGGPVLLRSELCKEGHGGWSPSVTLTR